MRTDFEEKKIKFSTGFSMKNIPREVGKADMEPGKTALVSDLCATGIGGMYYQAGQYSLPTSDIRTFILISYMAFIPSGLESTHYKLPLGIA